MNWASPALAGLVAAALIPLLILLYFLKLKRQEKVIPSTLLWMQAVQDLQANAPFQRLRMNILLFLQLLALILLLLAIARPELTGGARHGRRTALLIDRSASMNATDVEGAPTRLDIAKQQAIEYINGIDRGDILGDRDAEQVMIIGFADRAQVYSGFTGNKAELINAVQQVTQTHGGSSIQQALELARAYSIDTTPEGEIDPTASESATILLFSDGRINDLASQIAKRNEQVQFKRIGDPDGKGNVGISAMDARRVYSRQDDVEIYVGVANYRMEPIAVNVFLSASDQLLKTARVTVPAAREEDVLATDDVSADAGETGDAIINAAGKRLVPGSDGVVFSLTQPRGISLGAEIEIDDDLPADNRAYVVVPPSRLLRVGLVTAYNATFVEHALQGVDIISRLERLTVSQYEALAASGETNDYDLIVLEDVTPSVIGPGRYLSFGLQPAFEPFTVSEEKAMNAPIAWDVDHPINVAMHFDDPIWATEYYPFEVPEQASVVVEGLNGPWLIEMSRGNIHMLMTPFKSAKTSWPATSRFPFFILNTTDYLGNIGEALTDRFLLPGEALTARLPQDAKDIELFMPNREDSLPLAPADPSFTTYGPLEYAGLYRLTYQTSGSDDPEVRDFAVNMFDSLEMNIRPTDSVKFGQDEVTRLSDEEGLQKRPLWPWAMLLALAVMMIEWWVYNRRSYI